MTDIKNIGSTSRPRFGGQAQKRTPDQNKRSFLKPIDWNASLGLIQKSGNIIAILYIFGGEWVLPEQLKASTFIAARISEYKEKVIVDTAYEEAQALTTSEIAKAHVTYVAQCESKKQDTILSLYQACILDPKKSLPHCEYERTAYLESYQCADYPTAQTVLDANKEDIK